MSYIASTTACQAVREGSKPSIRTMLKKHIVEYRRKNQKLLTDYKRTLYCVDCGFSGNVHPYVLQFDHLKEKEFDVSVGANRGKSFSTIMREVEKCEVVCANCHAIRTRQRFLSSGS